jgi:predicted AlkP superfamily phosphohydrolase/phosphomutase
MDLPGQLFAYIGPGAGIALVGSFLVVLAALVSAVFTMLTWPMRRLWRALRGRQALRKAKVKRVVVLGLDGLEPTLTEQYLAEGLLPNLAKLKETGSYHRLGTTWPPLSPVAWSSFATGTNPGKHNIFDFIARDPRTYRPAISSVRIGEPRRRLKLGRYTFPLSKPEIKLLRKSKPFWSVLGESGIFSAILRVPITFPPDRFHGVQLSAMCVPDLLGTQGTFLHYSDQGTAGRTTDEDVGGQQMIVERDGNTVRSYLPGPANPLEAGSEELRIPFTVVAGQGDKDAILKLGGQEVPLPENTYTDWVKFSYKPAPGISMRGISRFYLKQMNGHFSMYSTPLQIDPDRPVMPISHPPVYSSYLSRQQGPFATLGLAEDTWSLSEELMSEDAFLDQAYNIHEERTAMFFDSLTKVRQGMVVCVFDAPDRIQHMFWRFVDEDHPALRGRSNTHGDTIPEMYQRMDDLVGETVERLGEDTALLVMSDHGFKPFRRCVDLNKWLMENGYLKLLGDAAHSDQSYLKQVDWTRTSAYALGLAGIYINLAGRESQGIVAAGEVRDALVAEIVEKLTGLSDPDTNQTAVRQAVARETVYRGPYVDAAPDILVGYNPGYRVSWESAVGKVSAQVLADNKKAWSGDHCIHPEVVPGILFSSLPLESTEANIMDIAPTALEWLGVDKPHYMDGNSLLAPATRETGDSQ